MGYQLIMFDFDGTLGDSLPWFGSVLNQVADRFSFRRIDAQDVDRLRRMNSREILQFLRVPWWKVPLIARHMRQLIAQDAHRIALFPGIPEVLQHLFDRGVILGMVTSNSEDNVRRILGPELAGWFRYYECGVSLLGKARRLRRVLRQSGVPAASAVFVGDEIRDIEAARAVGVASAAVSWGYNARDALVAQRPTAVLDVPADISRLAD